MPAEAFVASGSSSASAESSTLLPQLSLLLTGKDNTDMVQRFSKGTSSVLGFLKTTITKELCSSVPKRAPANLHSSLENTLLLHQHGHSNVCLAKEPVPVPGEEEQLFSMLVFMRRSAASWDFPRHITTIQGNPTEMPVLLLLL